MDMMVLRLTHRHRSQRDTRTHALADRGVQACRKALLGGPQSRNAGTEQTYNLFHRRAPTLLRHSILLRWILEQCADTKGMRL